MVVARWGASRVLVRRVVIVPGATIRNISDIQCSRTIKLPLCGRMMRILRTWGRKGRTVGMVISNLEREP
jgi:hypothetical protein